MAVVLFFLLLFQGAAPAQQLERVRELRGERRFGEAVERVAEIGSRWPDFYQRNGLAYLEGVLRVESRDREGASAIFSKLLQQDGFPFRDNLLLRLLSLRREEPFSVRAPFYEEFIETYPDHPSWPETVLAYGSELEKAGRVREAGRQYDRLWKRRISRWSRRAALRHALLHVDKGEKGEAYSDLRNLIIKSERDDVAYSAATEIHKLRAVAKTREVDARRLARVFLNNRRTKLAREYLRRLLDDFPKSLSNDQYGYLWGRSFVLDGDYDKAIEAYRRNYKRHPNGVWGIYSQYLVANTALRKLDYASAAKAYREVIESRPKGKYAARAFYNLADCLVWMGDDEKAVETIREGLRRSPAGRLSFLYYLARHSLERDELTDALGYLLKLDGYSSRRLPDGVTREEIHYWKGFCLDRLDRPSEAAKAYQVAADGRPNYFSYLARFRLPEGEPQPSSEPESDWTGRLLTARDTFTEFGDRKAFFDTDPNARVRELIYLGLFDEAAREVQRSRNAAFPGGNIDRLLNLAYYADKGRLPAESIAAAERLRDTAFSRRAPSQFPEPVRSLLFPKHYWELVTNFGARHGVEPELILSVIRQESRFQADAKSPASARGLMQFMTSTAAQLANELHIDRPAENDLYRPELSVQLGSYYLSKLLKEFNGSIEKALAAYNGGSENVDRWSAKLSTDDPAFFVANIGYRETKLYVLTVMGNYFAYRTLDNRPVAIGSTADSAGR